MLDFSDNEDDMFSLTANLGSSCVDTSKLVSYMSQDDSNIGMKNFKSRKLQQQQSHPPTNTAHPYQQQAASCPGGVSLARMRWFKAAHGVKSLRDPWAEFHIDTLPAETCIRHRYNAIKKQWTKDECTVKMEPKRFQQGAMRACFRM